MTRQKYLYFVSLCLFKPREKKVERGRNPTEDLTFARNSTENLMANSPVVVL